MKTPSVQSAALAVPHDPERDLLRVENLRVSFGEQEVVHDVSFSLAPGECLAIVGESGSGKSVSARTLVGLTGERSRVSVAIAFTEPP